LPSAQTGTAYHYKDFKMNKLGRITLVAFLLAALGGCISVNGEHNWDNNDWEENQELNRKIISELVMGTGRKNVLNRMGTPNFSEAFVKDERQYSVLFYRTHRSESDGSTTKDETTPLVFEDDKLIGWGADALSSVRP
jgi:outer membrane protein assembly factor BamE (lipoprotein component of BamABCDE complex)